MPSSLPPPAATPSSNNQHAIAQQLAALQATKQQNASPSPAISPSPAPPKKARFTWTGFKGKTLWDWLDFLVKLLGALAIPLVVVLASNALNTQQQQIAETQHTNELAIADDQQKEATLKTYLDDMSVLLLNYDLRKNEVRQLARERTLTTFRRLDANRNMIVLQFLQDAHLIGEHNAVIDLSDTNLSGVDLSGANLSKATLSRANLSKATLSGATLSGAFLDYAKLDYTHLSGADLSGADLSGAILSGAFLDYAKLRRATLSGAYLANATLSGSTLLGADLSGAILINANLSGVDLTDANLTDANLTDATLTNATLKGATMPDGSKHP